MESAEFLYLRIQQLRVPLIIVQAQQRRSLLVTAVRFKSASDCGEFKRWSTVRVILEHSRYVQSPTRAHPRSNTNGILNGIVGHIASVGP